MFKRKNINIFHLLIGRIATNIADSLFYMAVLWFFKTKFHSPLALSLLFVADSTIDMIAFIFGPLIDRIYIKTLLKLASIGQIIFSILTAILFLTSNRTIELIIALLVIYVLSTISSTLIYPAEEKILPVIVSKNQLTKINGIFQMTYRTLDLFLDALATAIIANFSINSAVIISAIFFAVALMFYSKLYLPNKLKINESSDYFTNSYLQDLTKGWQILKEERRVLLLILPFAITNLFYGIASVGLPYFASKYLTSSAIGYGSLEFSASIGGLIGSILVQHFLFGEKKLEHFATLSLLIAGLSTICETTFATSMPIMLLFFAGFSALWISMMNVNFEVLIQKSFSPHVLGRIETINSSIINCMIPIGSFLGGIIVQNLGTNWAVGLQGLAEVITAIFYLFVFIKLKKATKH